MRQKTWVMCPVICMAASLLWKDRKGRVRPNTKMFVQQLLRSDQTREDNTGKLQIPLCRVPGLRSKRPVTLNATILSLQWKPGILRLFRMILIQDRFRRFFRDTRPVELVLISHSYLIINGQVITNAIHCGEATVFSTWEPQIFLTEKVERAFWPPSLNNRVAWGLSFQRQDWLECFIALRHFDMIRITQAL